MARLAKADRPVGPVPVQEGVEPDHTATRRSGHDVQFDPVPTQTTAEYRKSKEWVRPKEMPASSYPEAVGPGIRRERNPLKSEEKDGRRPPKFKPPEGKAPKESEDTNLGFVPLDIGDFASRWKR